MLRVFFAGVKMVYYSTTKNFIPTQTRDIVWSGLDPNNSVLIRPTEVSQNRASFILLHRDMSKHTLSFSHEALHLRHDHGVHRYVQCVGFYQLYRL